MKQLVTLLGAAALSACASLPGKAPAPALQSQSAYASAQAFAAPVSDWPANGWWKVYGDAQLDALIDEGLAGSPSIAVADARLRRAQSFQAQSRGALAPQVSFNAS